MTTSHLRLEGGWAVCPAPEACELLFHVPKMSPAEAEALPASMLEPLLETVQPPTTGRDDTYLLAKHWMAPEPRSGVWQFHRDYDLPALIFPDGSREWYQRGHCHRGGDRPALVNTDGTSAWYGHGDKHRGGDKPAVVYPYGQDWFFRGLRHRGWGRPARVLRDESTGDVTSRYWFFLGFEHRLFGPSRVTDGRVFEWRRFGRLHRLFGPAVTNGDGSTQWWWFGRQVFPRWGRAL